MATAITDVGRDWVRDVAVGERDAEIAQIAVGIGTSSPSTSDETLDNELFRASKTGSTVTIESTSGTGNYRCIISITGGSEIPADTAVTEFGILSSDDVLIMREVRSEVILENGDTKTFEIPMNFDI